MKHLKIFYIVLLVFSCLYATAQNDKSSDKLDIRVFISGESGIQDNQLSKAHHIGKGIGFDINLFSIKNIRIGVGYHLTSFNVRNESLIGNYKRTNFTDFYTNIYYKILPKKKIFFEPEIQLGISFLRQKSSKIIHHSNITNSKIMYATGLAMNYRYKEQTTFFIKMMYKGRIFHIESIPEYEDFFNKNHSLAFVLGANFTCFKW
jgi:hypothetical protein